MNELGALIPPLRREVKGEGKAGSDCPPPGCRGTGLRPDVHRWRPGHDALSILPSRLRGEGTGERKAARRAACSVVLLAAALVASAVPAAAQFPAPPVRATFREAVEASLKANPSVQQAAQGILQAQALLNQATAAFLPQLAGNVTTTTLNRGQSFNGVTTTPRNQAVGMLGLSSLLFAPVQWALRTEAGDNVRVARENAADVRRQVAQATAEAYLAVIARRRVLDVNIRARDDARAHTELAQHQLEAGSGSLLNELRAAQLQSSDEVLVEQAGLDLARAQEALGVLMAAPGPVDAVEEPQLEVPASVEAAEAAMPGLRTDVRLAFGREQAARRVVTESWKDWLPSVSGAFQPQVIQPTTLFDPYRFSWRAQVFATVPIFDAGTRRAVRAERQVVLEQAVFEREGVVRQARSDVRIARVAVDSAVRALASARTAADQAHQVVRIVDVAFQAGSSTDIEVIDAQLAARNADTAAAVAEDQLRQARLALLLALGLFPGTP